ncbi:MAG: PLP-dependent aminotransferase family protein [Chloroflexales bacterium]|nr:PLP-dependent aminotransferase family protein [Chloroflexales bacterium]
MTNRDGPGSASFDLANLTVDAANPTPRYRQIVAQLRAAIDGGTLAPETRLPPTRALATSLGVSRITAVAAYEQLIAEGYLVGRVGTGTRVADAPPHPPARPMAPPDSAEPAPPLAPFGAALAATPLALPFEHGPPRLFRPNVPDLRLFPARLWVRLLARQLRDGDLGLLGYGDPAGLPALRATVAQYLATFRGVQCTPEQVLITGGSQGAIALLARTLLAPGDTVWMEHPGYPDTAALLRASEMQLAAVPVDDDGLRVDVGEALAPHARLAYVTPGHQMPTGASLSQERGLALLGWAARAGAWVLEDDYDGEYRYDGPPHPALQRFDQAGRVLYLGTFSKTLAPALRLGYLVVPPPLVEPLTRAQTLLVRQLPTLEQAALAAFIAEGHLARHIRRTREQYAQRRGALVAAIRAAFGERVIIGGSAGGLHLVVWLATRTRLERIVAAARHAGIELRTTAEYATEGAVRPGLLLGFALAEPDELRGGVERLRAAIDHLL